MVITGYYDVDMANAQEDYETTDPTEMLAIDQENTKLVGNSVLDSFGIENPEVVLSWEN